MRAFALLLLVLCGCTTAATRLPREIKGWVGWLCLDLPSPQPASYWYLSTQALETGHAYAGSCDSWARSEPPPEASQIPEDGHPRTLPSPKPIDLSLLGPFKPVASWPGWLCADFKDQRKESVWRTASKAGPPDTAFPGRCADWDEGHGKIRSRLRAPTYSILGGKARATLLLDGPIGSADLALQLIELDPGASIAEHVHETSAEVLYIEQGSVEMTIGGKRMSARAGDAIRIPADLKHSARVLGDTMVKAVQIYSPPGPEQRFTKGERIR